jgi:hypothetical protein
MQTGLLVPPGPKIECWSRREFSDFQASATLWHRLCGPYNGVGRVTGGNQGMLRVAILGQSQGLILTTLGNESEVQRAMRQGSTKL